ncbi:MAG: metalloregulator ArsR/SmtB family transcription factor [Proteobacteria bacterium]|nr:metalloregulator ArsR/SmtB family transcription factor [Pseudomonadota bacterium]
MNESLDQLVTLFKALADPTRLRMVGLLAERERCGRDLASVLHVSPATVSHHLKLLRRAGLVAESRKQPYTFYALDHRVLQDAVRDMVDTEKVQEIAAGSGLPEEKRKVLRNFFDGPRLISIPAQRRKKEIVFEELLRRLPRRKEYEEKQLSRFIEAIHPDFCTIRREFIMGRYMEREDGRYRLTEKGRAAIAEGR